MDDPLKHWIPEPTIILLGCQAWPLPPNPDGSCPVCGRGVSRDNEYCSVCDALSPKREGQVRKALRGGESRDRARTAEAKARAKLRRSGTVLTESERRRVWNGYRGSLLSATDEPTNRAKIGRDWLTEIGQEPDWSLELVKRRWA